MVKPSFDYERIYWKQNLVVAGVDEVGKGSFAGPVVAAAVVFPPNFQTPDMLLTKVNDSKLLSAKMREKLAEFLKTVCTFTISEVSVEAINTNGIGKATTRAILQAVGMLVKKPDHVLIDGYWKKKYFVSRARNYQG